jgi:hypothetical protein
MEELQFGGQANDCNFLKDRIYPVNKKSVNAAFGSAMIVRKLLLSIAQATR